MKRQTTTSIEVLKAIRAFHERNGYPPTVREIGGAVGLRSSASVQSHIHRLIRLRLLKGEPGKMRTLVLTASGKEASR